MSMNTLNLFQIVCHPVWRSRQTGRQTMSFVFHNPGFQLGLFAFAPFRVERNNYDIYRKSSNTFFDNPCAFIGTTLKGSNLYYPGHMSGVKPAAYNFVWRLICALANKMTNNHPALHPIPIPTLDRKSKN